MLAKEWVSILAFGIFLYGIFCLGRENDRWMQACTDRGGRRISGGECVLVQVLDAP